MASYPGARSHRAPSPATRTSAPTADPASPAPADPAPARSRSPDLGGEPRAAVIELDRRDLAAKDRLHAFPGQRAAELRVAHADAVPELLGDQLFHQAPVGVGKPFLGDAGDAAEHVLEFVVVHLGAGLGDLAVDAGFTLQLHPFREKRAVAAFAQLAGAHAERAVLVLVAVAQRGEGVVLRPGVEALGMRSEEHTSELQSRLHLVCRLLLEKKNCTYVISTSTSSSLRLIVH